jgi:peptidoglycan/xylan/chitin deacetylase (PgdA/CDA1 family)
MLGLGVASVIAGCSSGDDRAARPGRPSSSTSTSTSAPERRLREPTPQRVQLDAFPPPRPGQARKVTRGPAGTDQIAITIDDGYCADCVAAYVRFAETSGIHITFSPNGAFQEYWNPHAPTLRGLVEAGQVQIGNHTFSHPDLKKLTDAQVRAELERNEQWIQATFGVTTRPWYRPPFGFHDDRVDAVAGSLGYTRVLMWNGSFGDARLLTPDVLMAQARKYLEPGVVMLGHANHPTVTQLFGQIEDLLRERNLEPVTLDEMFGTSRRTG